MGTNRACLRLCDWSTRPVQLVQAKVSISQLLQLTLFVYLYHMSLTQSSWSTQ